MELVRCQLYTDVSIALSVLCPYRQSCNKKYTRCRPLGHFSLLTSATLVVTGALLVVTRFAIRIKLKLVFYFCYLRALVQSLTPFGEHWAI